MHLPLLMGDSILHCHRLPHSIVVLALGHTGPHKKSLLHTALWGGAGHQIGQVGWGGAGYQIGPAKWAWVGWDIILGPPSQFPIPGACHFDRAPCSAWLFFLTVLPVFFMVVRVNFTVPMFFFAPCKNFCSSLSSHDTPEQLNLC